jgi:hypothetical protein
MGTAIWNDWEQSKLCEAKGQEEHLITL